MPRIRIELEGIEKIPKENFEIEFGVRSLDAKILDYPQPGRNLRLRVPKTHHTYNAAQSKYLVKTGKIIISLKKANISDHWFTLHKQNLIGETIDDK
jgi:hypothetical protein